MSKAEFRLMIDSEIKERFKAACKSLNPEPAMTSEISEFMKLYADYVEKTGKRPHIISISHEYEYDTDIISNSQEYDMSNYVSKKDYLDLTKRVEALENKSEVNSPIEKATQVVEEMSGNDHLESSLDNSENHHNQVSKDNGHSEVDNISQSTPKKVGRKKLPTPEKITVGTKLLPQQLTRRLSDYQISLGKKSVGSGTLINNRKTQAAQNDPNYHQEWIRERDPDGILWEYNPEDNIYVAIALPLKKTNYNID